MTEYNQIRLPRRMAVADYSRHLGELSRWGIPESDIRALLPSADRALDWISEFGDRDGDGFVEYARGNHRRWPYRVPPRHHRRGLAAALRDASTLSRGRCRATARDRFSTHRMVLDHLNLYTALTTISPQNHDAGTRGTVKACAEPMTNAGAGP